MNPHELLYAVDRAIGDDANLAASIESASGEDSIVVDFAGVRVARFSPDGLFRVYVGHFETILHAYGDEDQLESLTRAIHVIREWARGAMVIQERRSWTGRKLLFVDFGGFEQQFRRRSD